MSEYKIKDKNSIILRDYLARDRTILANRRTLLSFVRTSLGLISAGVAMVKLLDKGTFFYTLGFIFCVLSPIVLVWGIISTIKVSRDLRSIPENDLIEDED